MTRVTYSNRAYTAKEKQNAEKRRVRKKVADFLFNAIVGFTMLTIGLGILFGMYLLVASILGPILGVDLTETEEEAAGRYRNTYIEHVLEEGVK